MHKGRFLAIWLLPTLCRPCGVSGDFVALQAAVAEKERATQGPAPTCLSSSTNVIGIGASGGPIRWIHLASFQILGPDDFSPENTAQSRNHSACQHELVYTKLGRHLLSSSPTYFVKFRAFLSPVWTVMRNQSNVLFSMDVRSVPEVNNTREAGLKMLLDILSVLFILPAAFLPDTSCPSTHL